MPLGRPRLGQRRSRIELREETYKRWRETKQRLNLSSDNALAVYLLSRCLAQSSGESGQPLPSSYPNQDKDIFNSRLLFPTLTT